LPQIKDLHFVCFVATDITVGLKSFADIASYPHLQQNLAECSSKLQGWLHYKLSRYYAMFQPHQLTRRQFSCGQIFYSSSEMNKEVI